VAVHVVLLAADGHLPQGLKPLTGRAGSLSEPFEAQSKQKLRPPKEPGDSTAFAGVSKGNNGHY
jgi:hypothetical protein